MTYFRDRAQITGSARITREGYLVADALVARANNVQQYRASELGLTDRAPDAIVRVFRPEAEVFAVDSIKSASRLPLTLDHPPVMVDATNWREYAKGETGEEILRDGEFMRVPLRITDAAAVTSVRSDRREFSLGYTADVRLEAGVFDGQEYDAVATTIRYNHLAACRAARGGPELRIVDERPDATPFAESVPMVKTVVIDGMPVDVSNPDVAAQVVGNLVAARDTALEASTAAQGQVAERDATLAVRDARIAELEAEVAASKLTPAAMRDAVAAFSRTTAAARALGVTVADDMDEAAMRAAAVKAKMGDKAAGYTPEQIATAFDVLAASVGDGPASVVDSAPDPLRALLVDGGGVASLNDAQQAAAKARAARYSHFATAYRGGAASEG